MNLYEVVFESVDRNSFPSLLTAIVANSDNIANVDCTEGVVLPSMLQIRSGDVMHLFQESADGCISIGLLDVNIGAAILPSLLLRCVKYGTQFDLDFSFELDDSDEGNVVNLMKILQDWIIGLAKDINVKSFFGGMEPASDKETRYFTNQNFRRSF